MSNWQPIKTAPIHQTVLVAVDAKHVTMAFKSEGIGWMWDQADDEGDNSKLTHWMPLPPPPKVHP